MKETIFKVGDLVKCKPGFSRRDKYGKDGGSGYKENREFIIDRFSSSTYIAWEKNNSLGVYTRALELVNTSNNKSYEIY